MNYMRTVDKTSITLVAIFSIALIFSGIGFASATSNPHTTIAKNYGVKTHGIVCGVDLCSKKHIMQENKNKIKTTDHVKYGQMRKAEKYPQSTDVPTGKKPDNSLSTQILKTFDITAKEENDVYRWSFNGKINPTLTFTMGTNNTINIQNPTDTKHEFVIESDGKELAASGDVESNSSGMISFTPSSSGVFEYHCEYHPTTMNGTIKVIKN